MDQVRPDETVAVALRASDTGMLDRENAALHGVSIKTIRRWRRDYQRRGKLDLVAIAWRQTSRRTLSVSRREAVAELDALIGPKC